MDPVIDLNAELAKCKTIEDLTGSNGLIKRLLGGMIEKMLDAEMDNHLGYDKHDPLGHNSGNSRNGKSKKTVLSSQGPFQNALPSNQ